MEWAEILKSLLYDGKLTYGVTIWLILGLMVAGAFIMYSIGSFRQAFGRRRLKRMALARFNFGMCVKFKVYGDANNDKIALGVKESLVNGISGFDVSLDGDDNE